MAIIQGIIARVFNKFEQPLTGVYWTLTTPDGSYFEQGYTDPSGWITTVRTREPGDSQAPILTCTGPGYLPSITRCVVDTITAGVQEAAYQGPIMYEEPRKRFLRG